MFCRGALAVKGDDRLEAWWSPVSARKFHHTKLMPLKLTPGLLEEALRENRIVPCRLLGSVSWYVKMPQHQLLRLPLCRSGRAVLRK